ncbi:MAG: cytidine deaminase [Flavobacteriales bacterium]|nr:cytidine deaminase [Flavobacteriales bacterium]
MNKKSIFCEMILIILALSKVRQLEEVNLKFSYKKIDNSEHLAKEDRDLLEIAERASKNAYAPYSRFHVGAAVRLDNGFVIEGNNQENIAYPSGLCAERVAIFSASAQYPNAEIEAIAIYASSTEFKVENPVTPCGACRQVLAEYELKQKRSIKLLLSGQTEQIFEIESASILLPLLFNENGLKNS